MRLADFSGGLSQDSPQQIADNQLAVLRNWYAFGKRLVRRSGIQPAVSTAYSSALSGALVFQSVSSDGSLGDRFLVAGHSTGLCLYNFGTKVWSEIEGQQITASSVPWQFLQYQDSVYCLRAGYPLLVTRRPFIKFFRAGLEPPAIGEFAAAEQADGELAEGYYEYALTFRNSASGAESNPSSGLRIKTTGDDKWIALTDIPQPLLSYESDETTGVPIPPVIATQADEIRIWRSLRIDPTATPTEGDIGEYFYVDTIPAGRSTYDDHKAQIDLGDQVGYRSDPPPHTAYAMALSEDRLWLMDSGHIYWSEAGSPEAFYYENSAPLDPNDGQSTTGAIQYGSGRVIMKQSKSWALTIDAAGVASKPSFSEKVGCVSGRSLAAVGSVLLWYGGESFYRSDSGVEPVPISTPRLATALSSIPDSRLSEVVAAILPDKYWYMVAIPDSDTTSAVYGYDYRMNNWFEVSSGVPISSVFSGPGPDGKYMLYGLAGDGWLYRFEHGNFDLAGDGTKYPIDCVLRTKSMASEKGMSIARRVALECDTVREMATLRVIVDEGVVDSSRTISLKPTLKSAPDARGHLWKAYNLFPNDKASHLAIELEYTGATPLEVQSVELMAVERVGSMGVAS